MILALLACSAGPPHIAAPDDSTRVSLPIPSDGFQVGLGPFEMEPTSELYYCAIVEIPAEEGMPILAMEHVGSSSLHHFNVWGMLEGPDGGQPVEGDCDTVWSYTSMGLSTPLYASQTPAFSGEFGDGIAAKLPSTWALLELHALNPLDEPVWTEAWLNAYAADPSEVEHYANGLYGNNADISIPAGETRAYSSKCKIDRDINVVVLASHFHSAGERFEIWTLDDQDQADELVYESDDWQAPELTFFDQDPIQIPAGGGFEYRCEYDNDSDQDIAYGYESDDEMCMMVGVYYPDSGFLICDD